MAVRRDGSDGTGSTATWIPEIRDAGTYNGYALYPANPTTTTEVHITVGHSGGASELVVNQRDSADQWHLLGTWDFDQETTGSVTVEATATGYHRADAIGFERADD